MNYKNTAELNVYYQGRVLCFSGAGTLDSCFGAETTARRVADKAYNFALREQSLIVRSEPPQGAGRVSRAVLREIQSSLVTRALGETKTLSVRVIGLAA